MAKCKNEPVTKERPWYNPDWISWLNLMCSSEPSEGVLWIDPASQIFLKNYRERGKNNGKKDDIPL
jgi:hypothetical protein